MGLDSKEHISGDGDMVLHVASHTQLEVVGLGGDCAENFHRQRSRYLCPLLDNDRFRIFVKNAYFFCTKCWEDSGY